MGCISLIVDNLDKICVTFKSGQPNFSIYRRKYDHGFREIIDATSREGCCGLNVPSKGFFLISDDDYIQVHNEKTYKSIYKHDIPLKESDTDDQIEILSIRISPKEDLLGVLSGKNLIKGIEELHQLHIYQMKGSLDQKPEFILKKECNLPDNFRSFSVNFNFD